MKSKKILCVLCFSLFGLWSCNQDLRFSGSPQVSKLMDPPVIDPIDPVKTEYLKNQGVCAADSSTQVTSCMKCPIPPPPVQAPQLSFKAQALLEIMSRACQVPNKSDPDNYIAPTREAILAQINRCSPSLYKDTTATSAQNSLIQSLVKDSDTLRRKMFGNLWYNPPYSDNFETFFGLDVGEARGLICYRNSGVSGAIYDAGYYNSPDSFNYRMPKEYVQANQIREDLKNCLTESTSHPWVKQPDPPPKTCRFESISGLSGEPIQEQVKLWLSQGWTVSIEASSLPNDPDYGPPPPSNQNQCLPLTTTEELKGMQGALKAAAYICR
ncbi:MAG: hypothetical protein JNM39_17740 [Bdellovibrionaceae bacterium]|nr:hypothetical protein [Pseudobdellovibrionaceae bacterium]